MSLLTRGLYEKISDDSFNKELFDHYLNEEFLIHRLEKLEETEGFDGYQALYWLSLARIMELALLCAGNYADSGQIREAGDLLVNPRQSEVHIHGVWEPVKVKRYVGMRKQFADYAPAGTNVTEWLRKNTQLVHVQGPLIPDLYEMLKRSDVLSTSYLSSVDLRMSKISETMTFVMQGQQMNPDYPLAGVHPEEREFVEANLCRYSRKKYHQIGMDMEKIFEDDTYSSIFLLDYIKA